MTKWDKAVFGEVDDYFPGEVAAEKAAALTGGTEPPQPNGPEDYGSLDPPHHEALSGAAPSEPFEGKSPRFRLRLQSRPSWRCPRALRRLTSNPKSLLRKPRPCWASLLPTSNRRWEKIS